ncbi:hypothetical protein ULMS_03240 [Patiriisocius marinistellae]|uniref:DUF4292 domain-containing protein n=1 Tax=Patiriisocius marinistellae TaxID=2494560 RepID=A0A5J4FXF4_9FLAO|nr:DUF4292 domain-containing protein [Patiriisocius marinistellae]GEQ84816.1 hypothetical protein ULMS_03240 [Patiriisocius marinistellae]
MKIRAILVIGLMLFISACGSTKTIKGTTTASATMTTKNLVKAHNGATQNFKTLAARLQVKYDDDKQSQSITTSVRMEKDKVIWIKASILGITLAKVLITPEKVSFYESIDRSYFEGDFALLSDLLGTEIDFKQAQSILLGNSIVPISSQKYETQASNNKYQVTPKQQNPQMLLTLLFNPDNFMLSQETVSQPQKGRNLSVTYGNYNKIETDYYPSTISILATENTSVTSIDMKYKKIDLNVSVSFPFTIPDGYKKRTLD